jgi:hypothetical protein
MPFFAKIHPTRLHTTRSTRQFSLDRSGRGKVCVPEEEDLENAVEREERGNEANVGDKRNAPKGRQDRRKGRERTHDSTTTPTMEDKGEELGVLGWEEGLMRRDEGESASGRNTPITALASRTVLVLLQLSLSLFRGRETSQRRKRVGEEMTRTRFAS